MAVSKRKFYRQLHTIEVLSEEPLPDMTLDELAYEISDGCASGRIISQPVEEVDGKKMADLLLEQASDPNFFMLNEDGSDLDDRRA